MLLGFTPTMAAISLLVFPSTTSFSTWRSRGLSTSSAAGLGAFFRQCPSRNTYKLRAHLDKVKPFFDFRSAATPERNSRARLRGQSHNRYRQRRALDVPRAAGRYKSLPYGTSKCLQGEVEERHALRENLAEIAGRVGLRTLEPRIGLP